MVIQIWNIQYELKMSWVLKEFQKIDEQRRSGDIFCVMGRINCLFYKFNEGNYFVYIYVYKVKDIINCLYDIFQKLV